MTALYPSAFCSLLLACYLTIFCRSKASWKIAAISTGTSALLSSLYIIANSYTNQGITESVVFHLFYGREGLNKSLFITPISIFLTTAIAAIAVIKNSHRKTKKRIAEGTQKLSIVEAAVIVFLSFSAVAANPTIQQSSDIYIHSQDQSSAKILKSELKPINIKETKESSNLIYIYAESLERTFFDKKAFPELVSKLNAFESKSTSFTNIYQAPLTDWTIAGMVASQCGIPLAPINTNRNDFKDINSFVPGATCLGDILKSKGYRNIFMGGADLAFAGKGHFYETHSFDEVTGLTDIKNSHPALPTSKWGIYDDSLFEIALEKIKKESLKEGKFSFFILTLDTHAPAGHKTPSCGHTPYADGHSGTLNSVKCADALLSKFLNEIEKLKLKNTTIVLASDHLQMRNDIYERLEEKERRNLLIINSNTLIPGEIKKAGTTLDIAPTVLTAMGLETKEMALGRSLLNEKTTLTEKYGTSKFFDTIKKGRLAMYEYWDENTRKNL
ncbi:sulfatase-like hydrolase/transferase [Pseudomonas oryzihabitans]|uniref:sulfatase-like hydrolase/transferase n=1 Tax=Pseudomonas oryzihabitans TaxID=47885 RepID=UPI003CFE4B48